MDDLEEFDVYNDEFEASQDVEVENLVSAVNKCRNEVEWLKKLKAYKVKPIDEKIKYLSEKESRLKEIILHSMDEFFPNQNTVDFPGVGKISKRKTKGKWEVLNEEAFIAAVEKYNLTDDVLKTKVSVVKKFVPSVVAEIAKHVNIEDEDYVDFVEPNNTHSVSFKFYDPEPENENDSDLDEVEF